MNPLNRNPHPVHKPPSTTSIPLEKQSTLQLVGTICENFNAAMTLQESARQHKESAQRHGENAQQAQQRLSEIQSEREQLAARKQELAMKMSQLKEKIATQKTQPPTIVSKS